MKPLVLLAVFCLLARVGMAGPYLDLVAANAQQKVKVEATAQGLGPDNLHCLLTNLTGQELRLRVPPGLHFAAADAGAQDIFTFEQKLLVLAPHTAKPVRLWAFCMEQHDYGPRTNSTYAFQGRAGCGLQPLGDSLQKYPGLASYYGQMFVWSLTDGEELREVRVAPALLRGATNVLRYLASVTGQPAPKARSTTDNRPPVKTFSKRASLFYHSPTAQVTTLKIYDPNGREMYELMKNSRLAPGVMRYTVGINTIVDIDDAPVYTIRLLGAAGQVLKEMKVDAATSEAPAEPAKISFYFPFELAKPLKNAHVRVRLPDGTLVEEISRKSYLPAGRFRYQLFFNHLYPPGTAFVVRLENEAGDVVSQQPIENMEKP